MSKIDDTYEMLDELLPATSKKKLVLVGLLFLLAAGSLAAYTVKTSANPANWVANLMGSIKKNPSAPVEDGVVLPSVSPEVNEPYENVNEPTPANEDAANGAPAETPEVPETLQTPETGAVIPATFSPVVIYFDENSSVLRTDQLPQLATFYTQVKNQEGTIEIIGYTDNRGRIERGEALSLQRAEVVAEAIKALDPEHIFALEVKGLGHANPAGDNNTVLGRQLNRRVEITFIPKSV